MVEMNRIALIDEQIHTASRRHEGWLYASETLENALKLSAEEDAGQWFMGSLRKTKSAERKVRALRRLLK